MSNNIVLLCARADAHAGVVYWVIKTHKLFTIVGFLDDDKKLFGADVFDTKVIGTLNNFYRLAEGIKTKYFICTGNNIIRKKYQLLIQKKDLQVANIIHPSAIISDDVNIGSGVFIGANVVINNGSKIGDGAILNTGTIIEHDNIIEDFVNISPGCRTSGRVKIESSAFLGTGVNVIPDITIGKNSIIGAGATVISNIVSSSKAVGVPAKLIG